MNRPLSRQGQLVPRLFSSSCAHFVSQRIPYIILPHQRASAFRLLVLLLRGGGRLIRLREREPPFLARRERASDFSLAPVCDMLDRITSQSRPITTNIIGTLSKALARIRRERQFARRSISVMRIELPPIYTFSLSVRVLFFAPRVRNTLFRPLVFFFSPFSSRARGYDYYSMLLQQRELDLPLW